MYALILINVYAFHEVWCLSLIYQKQVNTISEQMSYNPVAHTEIQFAPKYKHALFSASIRRLHRLELEHRYIS